MIVVKSVNLLLYSLWFFMSHERNLSPLMAKADFILKVSSLL